MVISCSALDCTNRQGQKPNVSFYLIPARDVDRRRRWLAAINRKDWEPSKYSRICSEHFLKGQKSDDPSSPDYVPSVFALSKSPAKRRGRKKSKVRQNMKKKLLQSSRSQTASALLEFSFEMSKMTTQLTENDMPEGEAVCQTDLTSKHTESLQLECQILRTDTFELKEWLHVDIVEQNGLKNKDKLKSLTGLHSYEVFMTVFHLVSPALKDTTHLTSFQQLLITLMRVKLNVPNSFLSYLFEVHSSAISKIFSNVINILNDLLMPLCVIWPQRKQVQVSMPMCLRKSFQHCMAVIDCFKIRMDKPKDLKARAQTYLQYKSHNTMKYLISVTPQGTISFISRGWGGRTTNAYITEHSGFLDNLLPGDLILADRGFTIQSPSGLYCAKVETPASTRGKKQLGAVELEDTERLGAVRTHVERVIGQARSKYKMLHGPVPIGLLSTDDPEYTTLDKIVHVACALTNLCPSVVPIN